MKEYIFARLPYMKHGDISSSDSCIILCTKDTKITYDGEGKRFQTKKIVAAQGSIKEYIDITIGLDGYVQWKQVYRNFPITFKTFSVPLNYWEKEKYLVKFPDDETAELWFRLNY